jgi:hypothetical protein
VVSWIVSNHPTEPDDAGRVVVLVALEDGIRFVSNLQDVDVADIDNDMLVEVVFMSLDGVELPQFRPIASDNG